MSQSFTLRADERGHETILSTGVTAAYVGGHPDAFITRVEFQFPRLSVGSSGLRPYPRVRRRNVQSSRLQLQHASAPQLHHLCFRPSGTLTHINTLGDITELSAGDYYAFSTGSGGLHEELNLKAEPMKAIYLWMLPDRLLLPPSYQVGHFVADQGRNRITTLIGNEPGAVPVPQDARVSRLVSDTPNAFSYRPRSCEHGVYVFVLEGELRCNGTLLARRDSKGVWNAAEIVCETDGSETDVLFVETILQ